MLGIKAQMAGLCWMAVTLGLLLSVGNSSATFERPDQNQLKDIVDGLWVRYHPRYTKRTGGRCFPMFSLAVSIPYNNSKNMYDISLVTDDDQVLKNTILGCEVYNSTRVVAATVLRWPNVLDQCRDGRVQWADVLSKCGRESMTWAEVERDCPTAVENGDAVHAEYRTLTAFDALTRNIKKDDFMLFYVLSSPCDERCTATDGDWSILNLIQKIKQWNNYAFVFSIIFTPQTGVPIPEENLIGALERLGDSIGLDNIFRCKPSVPCTSCSTGGPDGKVTRFCYTDDPESVPSSNLPSTSSILPPHGGGDSPSQSDQGKKRKVTNEGEGVSSSQSDQGKKGKKTN